ncbi:MAG: outer membrane beta-barrel protein [Terriglobales bacterium]
MYKTAMLAFAITAGLSVAASAQGLQHSDLSVQVTGVFTRTGSNTSLSRLANNSAGLLVGYRLHLTKWQALEVEYGYTRNGQSYLVPATAPGAQATNYAINANMQEAIANEVFTTPRIGGFLQPFLLGGGGVVIFQPRNNFTGLLLQTQTKGAINYGFGVDFHIGTIGARAEYQGLIFKIPDFKNPAFSINKWTHVAQPSVGLVLSW